MQDDDRQIGFWFGQDKYPYAPGFSKGRPTSENAAEGIKEKAKSMRQIALEEVLGSGDYGVTADEIGLKYDFLMVSIRPRLTELFKQELIFDSGQTRHSKYGSPQIVWKGGK